MQDEFVNIVNENKQGMFRYAGRLLMAKEDAEDVVQEVFIKIWLKWDTLDKNRVRFFAYSILRNACIDKMRSKHLKYKSVDINKIDFELSSGDVLPDQLADSKSIRELINQIIDSFPEQWKTIFQLCDVEGLGYDEVSEILGINSGTLRVSLSRIRKKIREILEKKYGYIYEKSR